MLGDDERLSRRPWRTTRLATRSTRSRNRRRLQPVPVARCITQRPACNTSSQASRFNRNQRLVVRPHP